MRTLSSTSPSTSTTRLHSYAIVKMTPGQRRALLAGVDAGGRIPDGVVSARVLNSIPEAWARTDKKAGRVLTAEGYAALVPFDRYRRLRRTNPESGTVPGLNYSDGRGLARDGLVIFQGCDGQVVEAAEAWDATPYITERGRKLIGMPLVRPKFADRLPVRSEAVWRREGEADVFVQVISWPFDDGTVIVHHPNHGLTWRSIDAPAAELHPH